MSTAKAISHTTYLIGVFLGSFHKVILATLFLSVSSFCAVHTFFSLVQYGNHVCLLYAESTATAHTHSSCFGPVTRTSVCVHTQQYIALALFRLDTHKPRQWHFEWFVMSLSVAHIYSLTLILTCERFDILSFSRRKPLKIIECLILAHVLPFISLSHSWQPLKWRTQHIITHSKWYKIQLHTVKRHR